MYGKHFQSTYTGSMVGAGPVVFAVWGYVIAHARDSLVELNPIVLAAILGCPAGDIESAVTFLCLPDSRSRSKISNGQRLIKEGEFIYRVPTHSKYRSIRNDEDRRAYMRVYMQEYRNKNKGLDGVNSNVNSGEPQLAHSEADTDTDTDTDKNISQDLSISLRTPTAAKKFAAQCETEFNENIWPWYPKRHNNPKARALRAYTARRRAGASCEEIRAGVIRYSDYCEQRGIINTEYVKQAATFFGPDKFFEEKWDVTEKPQRLSAVDRVRKANNL